MMKRAIDKNKYMAAVLGFVVGDALGVPVEFMSREELKQKPVTDMIGYGTHNQPAGTWSDDTSMVLATMEWLKEMKDEEPDFTLLMEKFSSWMLHGEYTPYGHAFDYGISTRKAIANFGSGMAPLQCGGQSEYDNGNGSLMRILPVALGKIQSPDFIFNVSALTHAHARSKVGCCIYTKIIEDLLHANNEDKLVVLKKSLQKTIEILEGMEDAQMRNEIGAYARLWDVEDFQKQKEDDIKSSGYVVDTLEAAVWCFLNTDSYKECVLKAVNLGDDTDTVGAVAGGLAGLYYGLEAIPEKWLEILPKRNWIMELVNEMPGHIVG